MVITAWRPYTYYLVNSTRSLRSKVICDLISLVAAWKQIFH
jgi:hypothetical protein